MAEGDKVIPHYYTIHLVLSITRRHQVNKCVCIPRTDEMTHLISTSSGRDGVRLAHHISEASMVTYFFSIIVLKTEPGMEHFKKKHLTTFVSEK